MIAKKIISVTIILILSVSARGQQHTISNTWTDSISDEILTQTRAGNYPEALRLSRSLLESASATGKEDSLLAFAYLGQTYIGMENADSALVYLTKGDSLRQRTVCPENPEKLSRATYMIYNALGIYCVNYEMNYEKATEYFVCGLNMLPEDSHHEEYAVLGHNLVVSFFLRNDPSGIMYAKEIFRKGEKYGSDFITFIGAYGTAMMLYISGKTDEAEEYIKKAIECNDPAINKIGAYNLFANILRDKGEMDMAKSYYDKAISLVGSEYATTSSYIYFSYGQFLLKSGKTKEAIRILEKGVSEATQKNNHAFTNQIYKELSHAYSKEGEWKKALEYFTRYHEENEKIINIRQERAINSWRLELEKARHDSELQKRSLELMRKSRGLVILSSVLLVIIVISIVIYILYRRKDKMYSKIASLYKEAISKEKAQEDRYQQSSLDKEKSDNFFARIEDAMKSGKLYRNPSLTRDSAAEAIGTNRTYLSQVINDHTGKNFNQYVNSFRIAEALEILSDPQNNEQLKAISINIGFNSPTTFFRLFKEEVGMTPSKYREKIIELSKTK